MTTTLTVIQSTPNTPLAASATAVQAIPASMNLPSANGSSARSLDESASQDGQDVASNQSSSHSRHQIEYPEKMSPTTRQMSSGGAKKSPRKLKAMDPSTWHGEKTTSPSPSSSNKMKKKKSKKDIDAMESSHHDSQHESPRHKMRGSSSSASSPSKKSPSSKSPTDTTTPRKRNTTRGSKGSPNLTPPFAAASPSPTSGSPSEDKARRSRSKSSSKSSSSKKSPGDKKLKPKVQEELRNGIDNPLPFQETDPNTVESLKAPQPPPSPAMDRERSQSPSALIRPKKTASRRSLVKGNSRRALEKANSKKNVAEGSNNSSSTEMNHSGNSLRHSSHHSSGSGNSIPNLYRFARKGKWDEVQELIAESTREDLSYTYKKDGTTALHLAVMSRTGYINSFTRNSSSNHRNENNEASEKKRNVAPLEVIEELLKRAPYQGRLRCTLNGYTPMTYACLVCNDEFSTEEAAAMVRLFIQYCPESVKVFTEDGLSPVDIHIVSYSHHHKDKEEESGLGNTSTAVLRTLLNQAPELANLRLKRDGNRGDSPEYVDGPLELLYKCNASAFSKAVLDEVYNSDDEGTIESDYTLPEKRQQVMDTVKTWWIWTWAVLILKYGSKANNKKRGARFSAVHTATNQVGVPTPLLSICLYAFPRQIKKPIEDTTNLGNLPLHAVCSWPCHHDNIAEGSGDALVSSRKVTAINRVLEEYPLALKINNSRGESALELALKTGTTWDGGVRRIVKAYPKAMKVQSKLTGLYPFMTAAAASPVVSTTTEEEIEPSSESALRQELLHVRTIFGLLRSSPKALALACENLSS